MFRPSVESAPRPARPLPGLAAETGPALRTRPLALAQELLADALVQARQGRGVGVRDRHLPFRVDVDDGLLDVLLDLGQLGGVGERLDRAPRAVVAGTDERIVRLATRTGRALAAVVETHDVGGFHAHARAVGLAIHQVEDAEDDDRTDEDVNEDGRDGRERELEALVVLLPELLLGRAVDEGGFGLFGLRVRAGIGDGFGHRGTWTECGLR